MSKPEFPFLHRYLKNFVVGNHGNANIAVRATIVTAIVRRLYKSRYTDPFANPCPRWARVHVADAFGPDRNLHALLVPNSEIDKAIRAIFSSTAFSDAPFYRDNLPNKLDLITDMTQNRVKVLSVYHGERADINKGSRFLCRLDRWTSRDGYFLSSFELGQRWNGCERCATNG